MRFKRFIYKNILSGYDLKQLDHEEFLRIFLILKIALLGIVGSITFSIADLLLADGHAFSVVDILSCFVFIVSILFIKWKKPLTAKYVILITGIVATTINSAFNNRGISGYIIFTTIFTGIYIIFSPKEKKHVLFLYIFTLLCILLLEIIDIKDSDKRAFFFQEQIVNLNFSLFVCIGVIQYFIGHLIAINNISKTKLKRLNRKLFYRNQTLEKQNKELDSFVYKASHDLRAPLTSLLGLIQIARTENNIGKLHEYINLQETSVQKMDSYIIQILELTKNARSAIAPEIIIFKTLLNDIFQQVQYIPQAERIIKTIHIDQESEFYSDHKRLYTILQNIISNSIQYYDSKKTDSTIDIQISINSEYALIEILDNGIGINSEDKEQIFDMFYRANQYSKGTGLGLYIVLETIKVLAGKITVTSEKNKWTKFSIKLPNLIPIK